MVNKKNITFRKFIYKNSFFEKVYISKDYNKKKSD